MSQLLRTVAQLVNPLPLSLDDCHNGEDYGSCWKQCRNDTARADTQYLSLALCYENTCYAHEPLLRLALLAMVLLGLLLL